MTLIGKLGGTAFVFSSLGHVLFHVLTALYLMIVLTIEKLWQTPYDELIGLWTLGALLMGAGAPLAGWLSDRWGESRLMTVYFLGIGAATMTCGLAPDGLFLEFALAALGLFGAIYHPVGTAWVTKHARLKGKAMALLGIFGVFGAAMASLIAGALIDVWNWRVAFMAPGAVAIVVGIVLGFACLTGRIEDVHGDVQLEPEPAMADVRRALVALVAAMSLTTVVYYAFTTVLPKWIDQAIGAEVDGGMLGVGVVVSGIYLVGGAAQLGGGHLADRGRAKAVYVASYGLKCAALLAAVAAGGWWTVAAAIAIVLMFDLAAPVENILIARFTSSARRGLAFGIRNGVAIAAGPLGIQLVAWLWDGRNRQESFFVVLALIVLVIVIAAAFLPSNRRGKLRSGAPAP